MTLTRDLDRVWLGLTVIVAGLIAAEAFVAYFGAPHYGMAVGADFGVYEDAARRWLAGGGWFLDHQVHGPYDIVWGDVLYPPTSIPVFVAFLVLPAPLWYLAPLAVVTFVVVRFRPAPWTWPLIGLCLLWPATLLKVNAGNPGMWTAAAVAGGLRWGWPGAFVVLKPTFAPLALIGVRHRGWWIALALIGLVTLAFLADTLTYVRVLLDARGMGGLLYSLPDLPLVLVPVLAWAGRRTRAPNTVEP